MQAVYPTVTADDGFYADGSFIQHLFIAYMGGYGGPLIDAIGHLMYLTSGTPWSFASSEIETIAGWVHNSVTPLVYQGGMMDMSQSLHRARARPT